MPALFVFLFKVNVALLLFCAGYYLVLRRLTFYYLNRVYLVSAILFASVYPEINLSGFAQRHSSLAQPVLNWQNPAGAIVKPLTQPTYWHWIELAFWVGVVLLAIRLIVQLFSLYKLYKNSTAAQIYNHDVRVIDNDAGPFSFWKSIYVNPANHTSDDLKAILLHEQIHVNEWHTLDILLAELSTIFYWFNPGVWLMKRAVRENIEFMTDRKILNRGMDTKKYQYSLVSVSFASSSNSLVNNFNISTIKKRIIMMNAKKSSKIKLTRYAFLVPAVVTLLLVFTISKAAIIKKGKNSVHLALQFKTGQSATSKKTVITAKAATAGIKIQNVDDTTKKSKTRNLVIYADSSVNGNANTVTSKQIKVMIGSNKNEADPLIYIIDGKVGSAGDLKKLHPDDITHIEVEKVDGKSEVFVNTKKGTKGFTGTTYYLTPSFDTIRSVQITGTDKLDSNHTISSVRVMGYSGSKTTNNGNTVSAFSVGSASGENVTTNSLTGKLVIIDDKVASEKELKNLSAFDIANMAFFKSEEMNDKYGERAKNGVVVILTKSGLQKLQHQNNN